MSIHQLKEEIKNLDASNRILTVPMHDSLCSVSKLTYVRPTTVDNFNRKKSRKETILSSAKFMFGSSIMLLSAVAYSAMMALTKWASQLGFGAMQIMGTRALIQVAIAIYAALTSCKVKPLEYKCLCKQFVIDSKQMAKRLWWFVIARGLFGAVTGACYFYAVTKLPLGDAVALYSMYPVFTSIASFFLLNEKLGILFIIALIMVIIGTFMIAQPEFVFNNIPDISSYLTPTSDLGTSDATIGYIVALASAVLMVGVFLCIKMAKKAPKTLLICVQGIFCLITAGIGMFVIPGQEFKIPVGWKDWLCLFGVGIVGYFAQWTLTASSQLLPPGMSSILRSTDIVWSYVWQITLFNIMPSIFTIIGAVLVIIGVFSVSFQKIRAKMKSLQTKLAPVEEQYPEQDDEVKRRGRKSRGSKGIAGGATFSLNSTLNSSLNMKTKEKMSTSLLIDDD